MNIFHNQVNLLANLESLHDSQDKRLFECFYHLSPCISDSYLPSSFPKQVNLRVLNCGWPFKRGKDNRNPHREDQNEAAAAQWRWPVNWDFIYRILLTIILVLS